MKKYTSFASPNYFADGKKINEVHNDLVPILQDKLIVVCNRCCPDIFWALRFNDKEFDIFDINLFWTRCTSVTGAKAIGIRELYKHFYNVDSNMEERTVQRDVTAIMQIFREKYCPNSPPLRPRKLEHMKLFLNIPFMRRTTGWD